MAEMSRRRHPDEAPMTWEGLTKEVRRLEHAFDGRLQSFREVINSSNFDVIDSAQSEVESILRDISHAHTDMNHLLSSQNPAPPSHHAALARHRDTLQSMSEDFKRLKNVAKARKDKESLLPSIRNALNDNNRTSSAHHELAREGAAIHRAHETATSMVELGHSVAARVARQGATFGDMGSRVR